MNKEINAGDQVKIIATKHKGDQKYIGLVGTVAQVYQNKADVLIDCDYIPLHQTTIIKKIEAEADKVEVQLNPDHDDSMYHVEFTMDKDGKIEATLYVKDVNGNYVKRGSIDVNTLIWKQIDKMGWVE